MFSQAFYDYFEQLFRHYEKKGYLNEGEFFRWLKEEFPETCQKFYCLQQVFFYILKEKCPTVCEYYKFSLEKCLCCKRLFIKEHHYNNFFITGGGEWHYSETLENPFGEGEEKDHFACYTYGSQFDMAHLKVLTDKFRKSGYNCDMCIYKGIWDKDLEYPYGEPKPADIKKKMNKTLLHKYNPRLYTDLCKAIKEKNGILVVYY